MYLNGKGYDKLFIKHSDIIQGGELKFIMGAEPNRKLGNKEEAIPYSLSPKNN